MKKTLLLAFAVLVLMVMIFQALPVRAVEFNFNGEYRIRAYAYDLDGTKNADDAQTYYDQRFRLMMTAKVNDSLQGVIRILAPNNDKWGTMYDTKVYDSGNPWAGGVDFDLAYLDFGIPDTAFNARVGKQYLSLGNYIVLGSYCTYDAILLTTKLQDIEIGLFTAKLYEGETSDKYYYDQNDLDLETGLPILKSAQQSEDDEDLYGVNIGIKAAPNLNIGIFGVIGNDSDSVYSDKPGYSCYDPNDPNPDAYADMDAYWLGATVDLDYAPIKLKLEADYSSLTYNSIKTGVDDTKVKGYALFGDMCADAGVAKVGISALYTTGDNEDDTTTRHRFTSISSRFSYMYEYDLMVINKYLEAKEGDQCISNLTTLKLYAMKDLTAKTSGILSVQSYKYSKDPDYTDELLNTKLGYEVDMILSHKLYQNMTISAGAAYWFTDKETFPSADDSAPDDNWLLKTALLLKF